MNRREFLGQTAVGLASLSVASSYASPAKKNVIKGKSSQTFKAKMGDIRAVYMQIGNNMWCDYPTEVMGKTPQEGAQFLSKKPDLELVCKDELWRKSSTTHNGWMGDYTHMVSSKPYYRMCEEVIHDVVEIFGHPRFFHIGYDEESASFQDGHGYQYVCARKDDFWRKDFYHIVDTVEKNGARAWMWSDYGWHHDDFCEKCPKNVMQQNWYYDSQNGGFDLKTNKTSDLKRLEFFLKLDEAGFDQVPCGDGTMDCNRYARASQAHT